MDSPTFPMRINKYLALNRYSTRPGADDLIKAGKVFINGKRAVLGAKVMEHDTVEVRGAPQKSYTYIAYHKPIGVITHSPQLGEDDVQTAIGRSDVFPVGRLDKGSHGLMLLTNDGRVTDRLLNPAFAHDKEYLVRTTDELPANFKRRMESGVNIEGYMTKPCKVHIIGERTFKVVLTEGKKHQIRRMCSALDQTVRDLKRIRILNIELGELPSGQYRPIQGAELERFLKSIGLA